MAKHPTQSGSPQARPRRPLSGSDVALLCFAAVALFLLVMEHRAHLLGLWPYLLLLACPLMHFLMHGHHGHPRHHREDE